MHAIANNAVSPQCLAATSIATYRADETVLSAASTTRRLLIFQEGAAAVVKQGIEIATMTEPGVGFDEPSAWLGMPHTADVYVLEESRMQVVCTDAPLLHDPVAFAYLSAVVQYREDSADRALVELKRRAQDCQLSSITRKTIDKIEESPGATGGNLVYAGYPYDPFALDTGQY